MEHPFKRGCFVRWRLKYRHPTWHKHPEKIINCTLLNFSGRVLQGNIAINKFHRIIGNTIQNLTTNQLKF